MPEPDPRHRSLIGFRGAQISWARTTDRSGRTAPARKAFEARFEREVDPTNTLTPAERAMRAEHARKAFFAELALKSAKARARRHRAESEATDLAAELRAVADELSGGRDE